MSLAAIVPGGGRRSAELNVADDAELIATLKPAADAVFLRGQLIGADGAPVARRRVTLAFRVDRPFTGGALGWRQQTTTLADGRTVAATTRWIEDPAQRHDYSCEDGKAARPLRHLSARVVQS